MCRFQGRARQGLRPCSETRLSAEGRDPLQFICAVLIKRILSGQSLCVLSLVAPPPSGQPCQRLGAVPGC